MLKFAYGDEQYNKRNLPSSTEPRYQSLGTSSVMSQSLLRQSCCNMESE